MAAHSARTCAKIFAFAERRFRVPCYFNLQQIGFAQLNQSRYATTIPSHRILSQWTRSPSHSTRLFSTNPSTDATESNQTSSDAPKESEAEEKLKAEIQNLNEKVALIEDKYKRSLAETENVRKRMQKQIEDSKLFGIQSFCKDLLEVADVLSKATESVPPDELKSDNPHLRNLYEGLTMTEAQLRKVFQRNGLVQINPIGEKFNPNQHEALFQQVVEGKEPGTVAIVTKVGYKLHERTIRPALVGVAKAA